MRMPGGTPLMIAALLSCAIVAGAEGIDSQALSSTFTNWIDHPAIQYFSGQAADPVAELNRKIQSGQVVLRSEGATGYLRAVLTALDILISSQVAVFMQDSVQAPRINQRNPRTLFFNDSVVVGWVGGGFIEVAAQDPRQGVVFYTLKQSLSGQASLKRDNQCINCHYDYSTVGVPGMLLRTADKDNVDHRLPIDKRWGGWYVTGQVGPNRHLGSTVTNKFDSSAYLSRQSDAVALLVFDHQMHMMNLLSRIGWEARVGDHHGKADDPVSMEDAAREVTDYMLFVDEAPLAGRIQGSTDFATQFAARGPRDKQGRSLRQLDLARRLLRYPCSYMIYSEAFHSLPAVAKNGVYQRMWKILSGQEKNRKYSRLSTADRIAVVEILIDTKKDLPGYFRREAVK